MSYYAIYIACYIIEIDSSKVQNSGAIWVEKCEISLSDQQIGKPTAMILTW